MRRPPVSALILVVLLGYLSCNGVASEAHPPVPPRVAPADAASATRSGYTHFYNLEYPAAIADFEHALQIEPDNPRLMNHVLQGVLFSELYRLDLLDTTLYAREGQGFLSSTRPAGADQKVRERVMGLADRVISEMDARLKNNPNDVEALFERGEAKGYKSTYLALIDKNFIGALRTTVGAGNDHERVLKLRPDYLDAKMIVGTHYFIVGSLPLPMRIMAGITGMSGNRKKGLEYLEDVAEHSADESVDARIALGLFLRREARYSDALQYVRSVALQYPKNFLLALEEANLLKDSGRGPEAIATYRAVVEKAGRGMFADPHTELAEFGLAETLKGQKDYKGALDNYETVSRSSRCSVALRQRASLAAGQMLDITGNRDAALQQYRAAIACDSSTAEAESARKLLKTPYRQ